MICSILFKFVVSANSTNHFLQCRVNIQALCIWIMICQHFILPMSFHGTSQPLKTLTLNFPQGARGSFYSSGWESLGFRRYDPGTASQGPENTYFMWTLESGFVSLLWSLFTKCSYSSWSTNLLRVWTMGTSSSLSQSTSTTEKTLCGAEIRSSQTPGSCSFPDSSLLSNSLNMLCTCLDHQWQTFSPMHPLGWIFRHPWPGNI